MSINSFNSFRKWILCTMTAIKNILSWRMLFILFFCGRLQIISLIGIMLVKGTRKIGRLSVRHEVVVTRILRVKCCKYGAVTGVGNRSRNESPYFVRIIGIIPLKIRTRQIRAHTQLVLNGIHHGSIAFKVWKICRIVESVVEH